MLAVSVILTLIVFVLYVVAIWQYRAGIERRYLWMLLAGVALDWIATLLMPHPSGVSFHAIMGWVGLGGMTLLAIAAIWELVRWGQFPTWGDWVVCYLGYPALALWLIAFVAGIVAAITRAPST